LRKDDQFLLIASDGFWDGVTATEATKLILSSSDWDNDRRCKELIELSKRQKSMDNTTVLLIQFLNN